MTQDRQSGPWLEIAVEVAGIDAETAADLLRQACPGGVAIETPSRFDPVTDTYVSDGDAPSLVKGYVRPEADIDRIERGLRVALQAAPLQRPPHWRETRRLGEADWRDAWKKYFGVLRAGRNIVIVPTWIESKAKARPAYPEEREARRQPGEGRLEGRPERPGARGSRRGRAEYETVIRIDPGMAFGTGQHPTTAMCLAALEEALHAHVAARHDAPSGERSGPTYPSVLDLGCGSGILSIAAAKLGARRVLALDIDPLAIKATHENAETNGVASLIEAREGTLPAHPEERSVSKEAPHDVARSVGASHDSPGEAGDEAFDVVVANISALTLERLAPVITQSLSEGGRLIASGFLDESVDSLRNAFETAGLAVTRTMEDGVWRAIIAEKP